MPSGACSAASCSTTRRSTTSAKSFGQETSTGRRIARSSRRCSRFGRKARSIRDNIKSAFKRIEERFGHQADVTGVASGIWALDLLTAGFQPGDLVVIAGRPGMGKSAFAGDILRSVGRGGKGKDGALLES